MFLLGYFVTSPIFGALGDRMPRKRLIAVGVILWSAATIASGLASSLADAGRRARVRRHRRGQLRDARTDDHRRHHAAREEGQDARDLLPRDAGRLGARLPARRLRPGASGAGARVLRRAAAPGSCSPCSACSSTSPSASSPTRRPTSTETRDARADPALPPRRVRLLRATPRRSARSRTGRRRSSTSGTASTLGTRELPVRLGHRGRAVRSATLIGGLWATRGARARPRRGRRRSDQRASCGSARSASRSPPRSPRRCFLLPTRSASSCSGSCELALFLSTSPINAVILRSVPPFLRASAMAFDLRDPPARRPVVPAARRRLAHRAPADRPRCSRSVAIRRERARLVAAPARGRETHLKVSRPVAFCRMAGGDRRALVVLAESRGRARREKSKSAPTPKTCDARQRARASGRRGYRKLQLELVAAKDEASGGATRASTSRRSDGVRGGFGEAPRRRRGQGRLAAAPASSTSGGRGRGAVPPTYGAGRADAAAHRGATRDAGDRGHRASQLHADEVALRKKRCRALSDACALLARAVGATGQAPPPIPSARWRLVSRSRRSSTSRRWPI